MDTPICIYNCILLCHIIYIYNPFPQILDSLHQYPALSIGSVKITSLAHLDKTTQHRSTHKITCPKKMGHGSVQKSATISVDLIFTSSRDSQTSKKREISTGWGPQDS